MRRAPRATHRRRSRSSCPSRCLRVAARRTALSVPARRCGRPGRDHRCRASMATARHEVEQPLGAGRTGARQADGAGAEGRRRGGRLPTVGEIVAGDVIRPWAASAGQLDQLRRLKHPERRRRPIRAAVPRCARSDSRLAEAGARLASTTIDAWISQSTGSSTARRSATSASATSARTTRVWPESRRARPDRRRQHRLRPPDRSSPLPDGVRFRLPGFSRHRSGRPDVIARSCDDFTLSRTSSSRERRRSSRHPPVRRS